MMNDDDQMLILLSQDPTRGLSDHTPQWLVVTCMQWPRYNPLLLSNDILWCLKQPRPVFPQWHLETVQAPPPPPMTGPARPGEFMSATWRLTFDCSRLKLVNLPSLELRCLHTDLLCCYKVVFGIVDLMCDDFFKLCPCTVTRGHMYKLYKRSTSSARSRFFACRGGLIYIIWNNWLQQCKCIKTFYKQNWFIGIFEIWCVGLVYFILSL